MTSHTVPILDSHIHLFPSSELSTLAWNQPGHPLWSQHSLAEYRRATASSADLLSGFIFLETDRRNDESDPRADPGGGWSGPLGEVSWLARIASGRPRPGEGHGGGGTEGERRADRDLCRGVVPWAPVPAGAEALARYLDAVRATCERDGDASVWPRVRGVRYLLQDKPDGTMLRGGFVDGVRLLGRMGLAFDVGVDVHRRGMGQLEEVVELVERAHEGVEEKDKVTGHVRPSLPGLADGHVHAVKGRQGLHVRPPPFISMQGLILSLSHMNRTHSRKLSGALCEMDPALAQSSPDDIFMAISPWLAVVVAAFGPSRIMFGSDWPVCTVPVEHADGQSGQEAGGGQEGSWDKWRRVVERLCFMSSFSEEETKMVFWATAKKAYGIE